jgi:ubiquinone/menaquinone biosynthesis C-methylase UbiE
MIIDITHFAFLEFYMFASYNYFSQHNNDQAIDNYKEFYREFSNKREFGGDFTHYDHLVKNRFMSNFQYVYNAVLRKQPEKILDVGCGSGVNLPISKIFPCEYHGLDYAENTIEKASKEYSNVQFHVGDAFNMEFESEKFDMVILSSVLILYGEEKDRQSLLRECLRVLKPDGVLVLIVWNSAPLLRASMAFSRVLGRVFSEKLPEDFCGLHFSRKEIRQLAQSVDARVEEAFLTSEEYGVFESVRYLNFQKYRRTFGKEESEYRMHPQSVLADMKQNLTRCKWLADAFYAIASCMPSMFSFFSVNLITKASR